MLTGGLSNNFEIVFDRLTDIDYIRIVHAMMTTEQKARLHDLVRIGELLQVLAVHRMPCDVAGEQDARLDVLPLKVIE